MKHKHLTVLLISGEEADRILADGLSDGGSTNDPPGGI